MDYQEFYRRISSWLRKVPGLLRAVLLTNKILTYIIFAAYPVLLVWLFARDDGRFWRVLLVPGVSFLIVTAVRKLINRRRPYESYAIDPLIRKDTRGKSMPSRHVFSSAVIAMMLLYVLPEAGVVFLIFTALLAVIRVLGGVHYPSDVIAGLLIGVLSGTVVFLI